MNEWVNKAFSLDIDYNNHIIDHVLFYNINLCIWFTTFHIAYPVLYSVLMIDNELLKGNQYWKSHKTYIKCRSWYVNSNCTEGTHSYSCGQQRTAAPARCSSTQQYCGSCVQEAEDSADGQRNRPTPGSSNPDAVPRTHTASRGSKSRAAGVAHGKAHHYLTVMVPLLSWDNTTFVTREHSR